uniref:t-SNARE coiled-coil homology domain-containing protein n=1 Tax=Panagrolaimus sp. JU765 TaxID=591449 RepID=A0AC34PZJ8_9BILA
MEQSSTQIHKDDLRFTLERVREDAKSTIQLEKDVQDLGQIMEDLASLVHAQHDMVDSIEEHVEMASHQVLEGNQQLKKALSNKNAQVPLAAAAVGATVVGGPVGFAAGSVVVGTIAAVGGAVAGLFSGRWIKKSAQESTVLPSSNS